MSQQQTGQGGEMQGGQGTMHLDVRALTSTISVAVAQAVKDAMAAHQATVSSTVTPTPTPSATVEQVVQNEVLSYTTGTIEQAPLPPLFGVGDQPTHPFSSIAVNLGSRVSAKIKRKSGQMNILTLEHCSLSRPLEKRLLFPWFPVGVL